MKFIFSFLVPPESMPGRMTILVTVFPVLVFLSLRLFQSFSFSFLVPPESVPGRITILVTVILFFRHPCLFLSSCLFLILFLQLSGPTRKCARQDDDPSHSIPRPRQHLQQHHQQHPQGLHLLYVNYLYSYLYLYLFFICVSICICQHLQQYHQQHPQGFHISCFLTIIITLN